MVDLNLIISEPTLNITTPIKRQRLSNWVRLNCIVPLRNKLEI